MRACLFSADFGLIEVLVTKREAAPGMSRPRSSFSGLLVRGAEATLEVGDAAPDSMATNHYGAAGATKADERSNGDAVATVRSAVVQLDDWAGLNIISFPFIYCDVTENQPISNRLVGENVVSHILAFPFEFTGAG